MKQRGFTLLELLLIVGIIAMISLSGFSYYIRSTANLSLNASANKLTDLLEAAHLYAQNNGGDVSWGVLSLDSTTFSIFSLDDSGTVSLDRKKSLDFPITISGSFSLLYTKGTGYPTTPSSVTLLKNGIPSATVHINELGITRTTYP